MNRVGIGAEYRRKLAAVITVAKGVITPVVVSDTLKVSSQEGGRILSRWNKQGWAKRLKHGVYIPVTAEDITGDFSTEDPWVLADRLFSPGYIAGFSAIKHWDLSEQIFETTTFFTVKKVKDRYPVIGSTRFHLKTVLSYKVFGTKPIWRESSKILVSDPSKTIVDILDDPALVGGMRIVKDIFLVYKETEYFDVEKIIAYAEQMKNKTIFKRFGFLMEILGLSKLIDKYNLPEKISSGYSLFDPGMKNTSIIRKWNLKMPPLWKEEHD